MAQVNGGHGARWLGIAGLAGRQLRARWLESLLIFLGIALGVGVFTGMETVSRHEQARFADVSRLMPQVYSVHIAPRRLDVSELYTGGAAALRVDPDFYTPVEFTLADVLALREQVPSVDYVFVSGSGQGNPVIAIDGASVADADDPLFAQGRVELLVEEATPDQLTATGRKFLAGAPFTWEDVATGARRIVLDETAAADLFPGLPPEEVVGRTITTASHGGSPAVWTVIGVVEALLDNVAARSFGNFRLIEALGPIGVHGEGSYRDLYVMSQGASSEELVREVQAYLDYAYGPGRVEVRPPQAVASLSRYFISGLILSGLALLIAALSLLNLFTARVLRRQRYTGMSVALGATRAMLFWQTAGEALLLGISGSLAGLGLAAGLVRLYRAYLLMRPGVTASWYEGLALGPADALMGLALGTCVSLLFGLYPAWLAARQQPAEALRAE